MGNGSEFVTFTALAILVAVAVVYPIFDYFVVRFHLDRIGKQYASEHQAEFVGIKHAKGHFSVVYIDGGATKYAKFRLHTSLAGRVRRIEWL